MKIKARSLFSSLIGERDMQTDYVYNDVIQRINEVQVSDIRQRKKATNFIRLGGRYLMKSFTENLWAVQGFYR